MLKQTEALNNTLQGLQGYLGIALELTLKDKGSPRVPVIAKEINYGAIIISTIYFYRQEKDLERVLSGFNDEQREALEDTIRTTWKYLQRLTPEKISLLLKQEIKGLSLLCDELTDIYKAAIKSEEKTDFSSQKIDCYEVVQKQNNELWGYFINFAEKARKEAGESEEKKQALDLIRAISSYRAYSTVKAVLEAYPDLESQRESIELLWNHFNNLNDSELAELMIQMIHEAI